MARRTHAEGADQPARLNDPSGLPQGVGRRYNRCFLLLLGRRSTVGQQTLTLLIGVRIPTSQPDFARASRELRLGRLRRPRPSASLPHAIMANVPSPARTHSEEPQKMTEPIAQNRSQVLAAKRWMDDEAGMERASLGPAEYVAYRMKVSPADAEALVAAVYALDEEEA